MATEHFVVVVGIDFSEPGDHALDKALEIASAREGGVVHVLHVEPQGWFERTGFPRGEINADVSLRKVRDRAAERLAAMRGGLGRLQRVVAHFRSGSPAENIGQLASDQDADLVVVGSNGHRGFGVFLGSVAEQVARLARCPVWIVRPKLYPVARRPTLPAVMCPACVKARLDTSGAEVCCEAHSGPCLQPPRYAYAANGICAAETTVYDAASAVSAEGAQRGVGEERRGTAVASPTAEERSP